MQNSYIYQSRRGLLVGALILALGAAGSVAEAQKISPEATKRKIELADDLYILNEGLITEAGLITLGFEVDNARMVLDTAFEEVNRHLDLLLDGDPEHGMEREHSVTVQNILRDLDDDWDVYGADLEDLAKKSEVTEVEVLHLREDSQVFEAKVTDLVDAIYSVYGEVLFDAGELRAITLLSHERAHIEEMHEQMVFAAVVAEEKAEHMEELAKLSGVFEQTIDVLIRNGAMFGVAPPPSDEAAAAMAAVEEHWKSKAALIAEIEANGDVTTTEISAFFEASAKVAEELDAAILAYHTAMGAS